MPTNPSPRIACLALLGLLFAATVRAAHAVPPESTTTSVVPLPPPRGLAALLRGGPHPWLGRAPLADVRDSLRTFYAKRNNTLCWIADGRPTAAARAWTGALLGLDDYGVPPADVDGPLVAQAFAALDSGGAHTDAELGDADVALSASIVRTLRALHSGRLDPARVDSTLILLHRRLAVGLTLDSLSRAGEPREWLERVQPRFRAYTALLDALARYRALAADSTIALPAKPPRLLARPSGRVARLKLVLERAGDLAWGTVKGVRADSVADAKLIAAIARFQRRHRLSPTGKLDSLTWDAMPRALPERIAQMGRTLEQYRWLPHELPTPLLFVNIPAFRLDAMTALDLPDSLVKHVNVVVGTAYKTQTPVLTAALTSLDFMPGWDVPPTIAKNEVLAEATKDPGYLAKHHMELIRDMRVLPPTRANIASIGRGVRVRQKPGPDNPLGRVKFVMPNQYDVYLHDSPARHLFGVRQRDFSHGCIRLADPMGLARWALRDRPDWTPSRIDSVTQGTVTVKARLPIPMLVAIVYATAEARDDGRVQFHPDVYGHDRALELLLAKAPKDTLIAERERAIARRHRPPAPPRPDSLRADIPHPPGVPPAILPRDTTALRPRQP